MRKTVGLILMLGIFLFGFNKGLVFAADKSMIEKLTAPPENETQWLWGEVVSVDPEKNEMLIKYIDYETDQEKEVTIEIDEKTTYENAKSLIDIKPQDTVAVDYIINPDGKNIAGNISLEKLEGQKSTYEEVPPLDMTAAGNATQTEVAPVQEEAPSAGKIEDQTQASQSVNATVAGNTEEQVQTPQESASDNSKPATQAAQ